MMFTMCFVEVCCRKSCWKGQTGLGYISVFTYSACTPLQLSHSGVMRGVDKLRLTFFGVMFLLINVFTAVVEILVQIFTFVPR